MRTGIRQSPGLCMGAALVMASSMFLTAHAAGMNPQQAQAPADNHGQPTLQMVAAQAELRDGIHAKKAQPGDLIRASITEKVKLPDGRELPVDTILVGHVDQVELSENKSDSMVALTFDKARLKGGEELPIKATLLSMWEPQEAISGGGAPLPGGQTSQSGMGPAIPAPMSVVSQGRRAVPGVKLHSDIHDKSSVIFTGARKNLDVPPGTQMRFGMVVIPAGMKLQQ